MDEERASESSDLEPDEPARDLPSVLIDVNENLRREVELETKQGQRSSTSSHDSERSNKSSTSERQSSSRNPDRDDSTAQTTHTMRTHQPHENLRETVFLRAEAIPEGQMKVRLLYAKHGFLPSFSQTSRHMFCCATKTWPSVIHSDKHFSKNHSDKQFSSQIC